MPDTWIQHRIPLIAVGQVQKEKFLKSKGHLFINRVFPLSVKGLVKPWNAQCTGYAVKTRELKGVPFQILLSLMALGSIHSHQAFYGEITKILIEYGHQVIIQSLLQEGFIILRRR